MTVIPAQAGIHRDFATAKFVSGGDFLDSGESRNDGLGGAGWRLFRGSLKCPAAASFRFR